MPAYCLFDNLEIHDPDTLEEYGAKSAATVRAHGGRYLVIGGAFESKEGDWTPTFPVLIEFPTIEAARAWYDSPEYAPLKRLRQTAGRFNAVFMEGLADPTS